jgi:uncharacterized membrane protein (UPF0127 family)
VGSRRGVATIAVLGLLLAAGTALSATAALRLDGVAFRPELARTPVQRQVGLMHRPKAPRDGMLFLFPRETSDGFWMKDTLVPLTIVFFDTGGRRVRRLSMRPSAAEPCPVYYPRRRYRFALELPATDTRPARTLGPPAALKLLLRGAS